MLPPDNSTITDSDCMFSAPYVTRISLGQFSNALCALTHFLLRTSRTAPGASNAILCHHAAQVATAPSTQPSPITTTMGLPPTHTYCYEQAAHTLPQDN